MSDLSIPGVTDKYNTKKIIDALMAVKKEPLTRMQKALETEQQKKTVWQDVNRKLAESARHGAHPVRFPEPLQRQGRRLLRRSRAHGTATRQAIEETKHITVEEVAPADRFLSRSLPRDFTVDPGQYTFQRRGQGGKPRLEGRNA